MTFPKRFSELPPYAFPRLRSLLDGIKPGKKPIDMTIGNPMHQFPSWVSSILSENVRHYRGYPPNDGTIGIRTSISEWLNYRYQVNYNAEDQIFPLNGTREGLFNAALALCPEKKNGNQSVILIPNPFYQVYSVAAHAANTKPIYVTASRENGFLPNYSALSSEILDQTVAAYICSPSNPQGSIASMDYWKELLLLSEQYDFRIFSDECYSEIYRSSPPVGILTVAKDLGISNERVVLFNSLSKRSNLAGLRSGFAASGPKNIAALKTLRNYGGAPLSLPVQKVSEKVWKDEVHVIKNRKLYQEKLNLADKIFSENEDYLSPEAGFFLWFKVNDGEQATKVLWKEFGVKVLPGEYLGREEKGLNPGKNFVRIALVAPLEEMEDGLKRVRSCFYNKR
jgi:aspartate/methionine/tyrosine aminotransferase